MDQNSVERIAGLEMQVKIFRWALGGFCLLTLTVSGSLAKWVYGQGSDVNVLKNDLKAQKETIHLHEKKIDNSASNIGNMGKNIQANTIHLENIKEMVKDIAMMLKNKR